MSKELDTTTLAKLRETLGDDYDEFLELFKSQSATRLESLRAAIEAEQWEDARRLAHGLKSSAAWVGLERLSRTLADMGQLAEKDPGGMRARIDEALTLREHGVELIEHER